MQPPPGIEPSLAEVLPDEGQAVASLPETIQFFAAARESPQRVAPPIGDEERQTALRRYLTGRQKLLDGEPGDGIEDLRQATRLDPESPEPWRELGEAAASLGLRTEAISAFEAAIQRGLNDARVLEILGRDALERSEHKDAAHYLARATQASPELHDPLLAPVIDVSLARALAAQGYIVAARDAIARALDKPSPSAASTRYLQEYGAIYRRQGDLWREVGDAHTRLGRYDDALEAYTRAADLPSIDEEALTARLVFAAMRAGRPAAAALAILSDIVESGGLPTSGDIALLRYIAGASGDVRWSSTVRLETASALAALRISLGDDPSPSIQTALTRAQAAVLSPPAARVMLRELVANDKAGIAAASDLLALCEDETQAAREAAQVVAASPERAGDIAEAILASSFDVDALLEQFSLAPGTWAPQLVAAHIHARAGRLAAASNLAAAIDDGQQPRAAIAVARFDFAVAAGRDVDVKRLQQLSPESSAEARLFARALAGAQRHGPAIELLKPFLDDALTTSRRDRLESLLLAGELAIAAGRADDAERWLRKAAAIDVHDERPYAQLLALYGPNGPRPDANRSSQLVRDLRQNVPESRTVRLLMARELARRGLLPQAEAAAFDLAADTPDLGALEILASVWQMQAARGDAEALDRGLAWIDAQRARRSYASSLLAASTTMLVGSARTEEAASLLREAVDNGAGRDAARLLERVMRDGLGRRSEADELAVKRLSGRRLIPADAVEFAEVSIRQQRIGDAIEVLKPVLDPDVNLAGELPRHLFSIADPIARSAIQSIDPAQQSIAVDLFDRLIERRMTLPAELHELRLVLLATYTGADAERIDAAARFASIQHPSGRVRHFIGAFDAAVAAGRERLVIDLARLASQPADRADVELLRRWFLSVMMFGDIDDARLAIEEMHRHNRLSELFRGGADEEDTDDFRSRAALTYAIELAQAGRDEDAIQGYELALEYDPDNGWACNNLGYSLLEQRRDLNRADELLSRAMALLPDEGAVKDSLGWLRYVQGELSDELDPETGEVLREGAVSLLRRAAETDYGQQTAVILDHYGDALWRIGESEDAKRQWEAARARAAAMLEANDRARARLGRVRDAARNESLLSPVQEQEYRDVLQSARAKIDAAIDGNDPPVAPLHASARAEPSVGATPNISSGDEASQNNAD